MRRQGIIVAALLASLPASAVRAQDERACDYSEFIETALSQGAEIARVAAPRANFFSCPDADAACRRKAYLIAKNEVLVSKARKGWICAWYPGSKNPTVGWLQSSDLTQPAPNDKPLGWLGDWSFADSSVSITREVHGGLHVAGDTVNTHRASQPSGGFEGDLMVDGPTGVFTDAVVTSCTVTFRRVDRYLIVSDGGGCAGFGASFMGVYTR